MGWDRDLLQAREHNRFRIRRRSEQQDPRHAAEELRLTRRGVPAPKSLPLLDRYVRTMHDRTHGR